MIAWQDNAFVVNGALTIDSVNAHQQLLFPSIHNAEHCVIDLEKVDAVDSSAVSLMLSWVRQAHLQKKSVSFAHAPKNLHSLVELYGLTEVLSLNS
ncbi:MAG: STAS domain-containing protein [Sideroxydans sp.]|nr:STAS domain-containing protein [Sideroxydans sp.]